MTTETIKTGRDTWASSDRPNLNRNASRKLALEVSTALAYKMAKVDIPEGATVTDAWLTFFAAGGSTGSRTLVIRRLAENWKPSQLVWNNKPTVTGPASSVVVGALFNRDPIAFDVAAHLQAIVDGSPHYGWQLSTSAGTRHKVWGVDSDYPPVLEYSYTMPGDAPTDLSPATGTVSTSKPVLTWFYDDVDDTELVAVRVQLADEDFNVQFDSGWVASSVPELDLAATAYAGLVANVLTSWRVAVIDSSGAESPWSDWVGYFDYIPQGALSLTSPTSGGLVYDATPDISWELSGQTQAAWRVRVARSDDPTALIYDSGKRDGPRSSHTIPRRVITDESSLYRVVLRVWDSHFREATPGRPTYVEVVRDFQIADGTTGAPTSLTVYADPVTPAVHLTWETPTPADGHVIVRDGGLRPGEIVEAIVDVEDTLVSGTTYQWTDWTAAPGVEYTYHVRTYDVVTRLSQRSAGAQVTTRPEGVWLVDPDNGVWICAAGTGSVESWARADSYGLYQPLGASKPVKLTSAMSGLTGGYDGEFYGITAGRTVAQQTWNLYRLARIPDRVLRLIAGDINIPVVAADLSAGTHPELLKAGQRCRVSWKFWQYGELPFNPRL